MRINERLWRYSHNMSLGWTRQTWLIARKDLRIEFRSGTVVASGMLFSLLITVTASLLLSSGSNCEAAASAVWAISTVFSSTLVVERLWQRERDAHELQVVFYLPCDPSAIFAAKVLVNTLFLAILQAVVLTLLVVFFPLDISYNNGLQTLSPLGVVALALPCIAFMSTLGGAFTLRTNASDLVIVMILLPILLPVMMTSAAAMKQLLLGSAMFQLVDHLTVLLAADIATGVVSMHLFRLLFKQ